MLDIAIALFAIAAHDNKKKDRDRRQQDGARRREHTPPADSRQNAAHGTPTRTHAKTGRGR